MFDAHALFKQRFSEHMKETGRYTKYIFNGHLTIAMLFFISALAYYYQSWLADMPPNFPTAVIMGIVLGLLISHNPVRTLLKEPDLFFLLPAEKRMGPYFRDALIYSFVMHFYLVVLVMAAFGPLYLETYPAQSGKVYGLILLVVIIMKGWNLLSSWAMLKTRELHIRRLEMSIRILMNVAISYFLVAGNYIWASIITILFAALFLANIHVSRKQPGIVWDLLVEKDRSRMQFFYRIANMFTDVPHLKNRAKRRKYLDWLIAKIPYAQKFTYDYLYRITFIRGGDYLNMYVRLIVLSGIFIYFIPNEWFKLLFGFLFLYMSCFQLMTIYNHHRTVMWLDLYPVPHRLQGKAVLKLLYQLVTIQTAVSALLFLVLQLYLPALIMLIGGFLWNWLFISGYVKPKLAE